MYFAYLCRLSNGRWHIMRRHQRYATVSVKDRNCSAGQSCASLKLLCSRANDAFGKQHRSASEVTSIRKGPLLHRRLPVTPCREDPQDRHRVLTNSKGDGQTTLEADNAQPRPDISADVPAPIRCPALGKTPPLGRGRPLRPKERPALRSSHRAQQDPRRPPARRRRDVPSRAARERLGMPFTDGPKHLIR